MSHARASQRIEPLQHLAESREEEASKLLLDRQRVLGERERRLHELQNYVSEYDRPQSAPATVLLLNRHQFVGRLREAVAVQQTLVEQARRDCDTERARWLLTRRNVSTLDQLADCYRRRERVVDERIDQKRMDEFALRQFCVNEGDADMETES